MSFLDKSDGFKQEYCCTVVRIGELTPIEGSDFLAKTVIGGDQIVVRKDQVKTGDIQFYVSDECQLDFDFLAQNNLFEFGSREMNLNYKEVADMMEKDLEKAKRMVGFFNKNGRVRAIRLRNTLSMGYLFGLNELARYNKKASSLNLEELIDTEFDLVDGNLFVKAYVPPVKENTHVGQGQGRKDKKKLAKLNRIIPSEFAYHYNTGQWGKSIRFYGPETGVDISLKLHGCSGIFGNIKVRNFIKLPLWQRVYNWACDILHLNEKHKYIDYTVDYGDVYSSRKVIKNANFNPNVTEGFYGSNDIWHDWNELIKNYIPQDTIVYGEIVGYCTNDTKMIQKNYDYGCRPGESKMMPYRMTTNLEDGDKYEWSIDEVIDWTKKTIEMHTELTGKLIPLYLVYQGTLGNLYSDIPIDEAWHDRLLERMQNDKERFGMEENEPLCKFHSVPREGLVMRIKDDPIAEAYKLKCVKFKDLERKSIDANEVDIEMEEDI